MRISLGREGKGLSLLGEYAIDEISVRGPPDTMIIRGKPANMRAPSKTHRYGSWENAKLADVVGDIARRNKGAAACNVDAVVPRIAPFGESDLHFLYAARSHARCDGDGEGGEVDRDGARSR